MGCPMFRAINSNRFQFPKHMSKDAIELIKMCLNIDPTKRPRAQDLLKCKWLQDDRANKVPQRALDVLLRTVIGDRTKWATHEELLREGWLGNDIDGIRHSSGESNIATSSSGISSTGNLNQSSDSNMHVPPCLKIIKDASMAKKSVIPQHYEEKEEVKEGNNLAKPTEEDGEEAKERDAHLERPVK